MAPCISVRLRLNIFLMKKPVGDTHFGFVIVSPDEELDSPPLRQGRPLPSQGP